MSERLDQECRIPPGTRDAMHVPYVVGKAKRIPYSQRNKDNGGWDGHTLSPGQHVKFTDDKFIYFVPCSKEESHGILNPFLDEVSIHDNVIVLLTPGITGPTRHAFDINPEKRKWERQALEMELEQYKAEDDGCADCYEIRNGRVIRN